jgi:transcriptional regulator with XRE-family HTH domain
MSDFYKELKELRVEAGINLEEIHSRTKISLEALRSIESGQFNKLPRTYIRLFVRAYANEIGADDAKALRELEKILNKESIVDEGKESIVDEGKESIVDEGKESIVDEGKESIVDEGKELYNRFKYLKQNTEKKIIDQIKPWSISAKNIRTDTVKGIALLSILIFSIYIIRQINKEEASKALILYSSDFEEEGPITNQILQNDFDLFAESVQIMEEKVPLTLKIATVERVWYKIKIDTLILIEDILPSGDNRLYEFSDSLTVLFKYSKGLNLYLNGSSLNSYKSTKNPLRVIFSSVKKTITTQQFVPKS